MWPPTVGSVSLAWAEAADDFADLNPRDGWERLGECGDPGVSSFPQVVPSGPSIRKTGREGLGLTRRGLLESGEIVCGSQTLCPLVEFTA